MNPFLIALGLIITGAGFAAAIKKPASENNSQKVLTENDGAGIKPESPAKIVPTEESALDDIDETDIDSGDGGPDNAGDMV